ncbi:MAG: tail fiber domain-containing protein [Prolixibacteraceae bacterium]|nr:tail fiber domain-containing protein [Prolixibacteraceae bacterium]
MKNKFFLFFLLSFYSALPLFSQIQMDCSGRVGIGGSPGSSPTVLKVTGVLSSTSTVSANTFTASSMVQSDYYYDGQGYIEFRGPQGGTPYIGFGKSASGYNLDVNGNIRCTSVDETSDKRFKKNISTLDGLSMLGKVMKVEGKTFEYKSKDELLGVYSSGLLKSNTDTFWVCEKSEFGDSLVMRTKPRVPNFPEGYRYGFIAQDIQEFFPEMVSVDSTDGSLSLNYIGLIPVLWEALKAQQQQIETLQTLVESHEEEILALKDLLQDDNLKSATTGSSITRHDEASLPELYQNVPNPFSESTLIRYFLTDEIQEASITVYDLNGTQLKSIGLHQKGEGNIAIEGNELEPGMYLYALIADGQIIDTKKMVLTD